MNYLMAECSCLDVVCVSEFSWCPQEIIKNMKQNKYAGKG